MNQLIKHLGIAACIVHALSCSSVPGDDQSKSQSILQERPGSSSNESSSIQSRLADTSGLIQTDSIKITYSSVLRKAYQINHFNAFWLKEHGFTDDARQYLQELSEVKFDGLDPDDYQFRTLEQAMQQSNSSSWFTKNGLTYEFIFTESFIHLSNDLMLGKNPASKVSKSWKNENDSLFDAGLLLEKAVKNHTIKTSLEQLRPIHPYYTKFKNRLKELTVMASNGGWPTPDSLLIGTALGISSPYLPALRKRLFIEIGVPADTSSRTWDAGFSDALHLFQYLNQLKPTNKIDSNTFERLSVSIDQKIKKLALNLDRLRWMKQSFDDPYIWVNVPKMQLDYRLHDSLLYSMRVVVGKPTRPTTLLDARLRNIVLSPPWTAPPTIMKEDIMPGVEKRGINYLTRKGLKVFNKEGKPIDPSKIRPDQLDSYRIGQAPGYRSSLGEVKFNLPNPWSIYLHDTPHREDFIKSYRALSSGCIRVHHPKEFAAFVLNDSLRYSYEKIDSICKKRKTVYIPVKNPVMVHIVYLTNDVDSLGRVMFLRDVYQWDKKKQATENSASNL